MSDTFTTTIKDISSEGLGVANHPEGFVCFVPGAFLGDRGTFKVTQKKKRYAFAKMTMLLEPSPDRQDSMCSHLGFEAGRCGGCPWLELKYEAQLETKKRLVTAQLNRRDIKADVKDVWASEKTLGYRNRAQMKSDGITLGYISPGTHELAEVRDCVVLDDENRAHLESVIESLPDSKYAPKAKQKWSSVYFDSDLGVSVNKALGFRQANDLQNKKMKQWLQEKLSELSPETSVVELFCGSGNFTEVLLNCGFSTIVAVEEDASALKRFQNRFASIQTLKANLFDPKSVEKLMPHLAKAKLLILDPPREGFEQFTALVSRLPELETIIYISCSPNSYTRDVEKLVNGEDWYIKELQPIDQFPNTPHTELLTLISKR